MDKYPLTSKIKFSRINYRRTAIKDVGGIFSLSNHEPDQTCQHLGKSGQMSKFERDNAVKISLMHLDAFFKHLMSHHCKTLNEKMKPEMREIERERNRK